jgi:hypothetical protein
VLAINGHAVDVFNTGMLPLSLKLMWVPLRLSEFASNMTGFGVAFWAFRSMGKHQGALLN